VIVYGHRTFPLRPGSFLREFEARASKLPSVPSHDEVVDLLVDFAEAESAVTDALLPDRDDEDDRVELWRDALDHLSAAFCASADRDIRTLQVELARCRTARDRLVDASDRWPATVRARAAEGFACYALYPEQYLDGARQFASEISHSAVVCLGVRSIGSVLSSVVAAALAARGHTVIRRTVRPRGHPFDRCVTLGSRLAALFESYRRSRFLIIDEGPGISGSSFAAAVDALRNIGVPTANIVLIPSWLPDADRLRSERARRAFLECRVVIGRAPTQRFADRAADCGSLVDVSAGGWRSVVFGPDSVRWPASHPQHERVKFVDDARAPTQLVRFAGLGRHGRQKLARAETLAGAGFSPQPIGLRHGFLTRRWAGGSPLRLRDARSPHSLNRMTEYLTFVSRAFATGDGDSGADLLEMVRCNASESLGRRHTDAIERVLDRARPALTAPAVAVDGRMLPHEWIVGDRGLMKVDALDHHADDFLAGCRVIAWDAAGACVECDLGPTSQRELVNLYIRHSGDRQIVDRLPFFLLAYTAYRVGYAALAAESLAGTPDGSRFNRLQERYRRLLARYAERLCPSAAR
jgi:hypothetical protein